jgi:hypothetical protein
VAAPNLAAHAHTVAVGEADIENGDVRVQGVDPPERLLRRAGLADHLDTLGLEQVLQPPAHHLVIVEEKDRYALVIHRPPR